MAEEKAGGESPEASQVSNAELFKPDGDAAVGGPQMPSEAKEPEHVTEPQPAQTELEAPQPPPGQDRDKAVQKLQQDLATTQRRVESLTEDLSGKIGQILAKVDQPAAPVPATQPEPKSAQEIVDGAFAEVDVFDVDSLKGAMTTAVTEIAKPVASAEVLTALQEKIGKIDQQLGQITARNEQEQAKQADDDYWNGWSKETGLTIEQRDAAFKSATEHIDTTYGYDPQSQSEQRTAAINVRFDSEVERLRGGAGEAPPTPNAPPTPRETPSAEGTEVVPKGSSATTGPPPQTDAVPEVLDSALYVEDEYGA